MPFINVLVLGEKINESIESRDYRMIVNIDAILTVEDNGKYKFMNTSVIHIKNKQYIISSYVQYGPDHNKSGNISDVLLKLSNLH